jgi:hypothetical protein
MPLKAPPQTGLVPCEFLIDRPPHVRGDVVGLPPALAERLIERGVAEAIDPEGEGVAVGPPEVASAPDERCRLPSASGSGLLKSERC